MVDDGWSASYTEHGRHGKDWFDGGVRRDYGKLKGYPIFQVVGGRVESVVGARGTYQTWRSCVFLLGCEWDGCEWDDCEVWC